MIQDNRLQRKEAYLAYLTNVPIHKWACKAIGVSENTGKNWRDEDVDFCDRCEIAISQWVGITLKKAKAEFKLERIMKDDFAQRTEVTGKDGGPLTINLINYGDRPSVQLSATSVPTTATPSTG